MAIWCRLTNVPFSLPLPKEVPTVFKALPEYAVEDVVDFLGFVVQQVSPPHFVIYVLT
jgi:ubiquitin conjugation factor E4 B